MSKKRFTGLFSLFMLSTLMMSPHAEARIPIRAFKNVTRNFKPGQEFNSPAYGEAALYSGLIYDLRFYGNINPGIKDGRRLYIADKAEDPLERLVKELFPSPTGALNVETVATDNFGRYVDKPETVALLINFSHKIRKNGGLNAKLISKETDIILASLSKFNEKDRRKIRNTINGILKSIQESVLNESQSPYPEQSTEYIINSFFCEKFSKQADIWALLRAEDDDIVDKTNIPQEEDLLEEEDLVAIVNKVDPYNADDLLALKNTDAFGSRTPYKAGAQLLSNGNARAYDRKKDIYARDEFADCAEIAARHMMNLLLFNDETQEFDLSHLKSQINKDNPYFKNFEEFYIHQEPLLANAGDVDIRSLWSRVVGDLNTDDDPIKINYMNSFYELNAGHINFVRVFQKVFDLTLDELKNNASLDEKRSWLHKSLTTLFKTVNPTREYEFNLSAVEEDQGDLSGEIRIRVSNQDNKELFSFKYLSYVNTHSDVTELKVPEAYAKYDFSQFLLRHVNRRDEGRAAKDALWLFMPEFKKYLPISDFHNLFSEHLSDNNSRIRALEKIQAMEKNSNFTTLLPRILKNILTDISWRDEVVVRQVSPVIAKLMETLEFQPVIAETVNSFYLSTNDDFINPYLTPLLERVKNLYVKEEVTSLDELKICKELNKLNSQKLNIKKLFLENFLSLESLMITHSLIIKNIVLKDLPKLTKLNMPMNRNLEEVSFENLDNLKELNLTMTGLKRIKGLNALVSLETLKLARINTLKEVSVEGLDALKVLTLEGSNLSNIRGLNTLTKLENLNLGSCQNLEELSLENLDNLKVLNLQGSTVKVRQEFNTISTLTSLNLGGRKNLEKVSVENLDNLEGLNLMGTDVKVIHGLNALSKLVSLNLSKTHNLEELSLESQRKLEFLNLSGSAVKTLSFENLDAIESLEFTSLNNTESIHFKGSFKKLKSITFEDVPNIIQLEGLEDLDQLETVNIKGQNVNRSEIRDKIQKFRPSVRVIDVEEGI